MKLLSSLPSLGAFLFLAPSASADLIADNMVPTGVSADGRYVQLSPSTEAETDQLYVEYLPSGALSSFGTGRGLGVSNGGIQEWAKGGGFYATDSLGITRAVQRGNDTVLAGNPYGDGGIDVSTGYVAAADFDGGGNFGGFVFDGLTGTSFAVPQGPYGFAPLNYAGGNVFGQRLDTGGLTAYVGGGTFVYLDSGSELSESAKVDDGTGFGAISKIAGVLRTYRIDPTTLAVTHRDWDFDGSAVLSFTNEYDGDFAVHTTLGTYRGDDLTGAFSSLSLPTGFDFVGGYASRLGIYAGIHQGDHYEAVNLTPQAVPEPASLAVLGLGAPALLRRRGRAAGR